MMPRTTTFQAGSTGENYPFGHAVSSSTDNVCWKRTIPSRSAHGVCTNDQAGIASGDMEMVPFAIGAGIEQETGTGTSAAPMRQEQAQGGRIRERHEQSPGTPGYVTIATGSGLQIQKKPGAPTPDLLAIQ